MKLFANYSHRCAEYFVMKYGCVTCFAITQGYACIFVSCPFRSSWAAADNTTSLLSELCLFLQRSFDLWLTLVHCSFQIIFLVFSLNTSLLSIPSYLMPYFSWPLWLFSPTWRISILLDCEYLKNDFIYSDTVVCMQIEIESELMISRFFNY